MTTAGVMTAEPGDTETRVQPFEGWAAVSLPPDLGFLEAWLSESIQAVLPPGSLNIRPLDGGGAVQEHWLLWSDTGSLLPLVLRRAGRGPLPMSLAKETEFRLLQRLWQAGLAVPEPVACCPAGDSPFGPFFVMRPLPGQGRGRQAVETPFRPGQRAALGQALGQQIGQLQALNPADFQECFGPPPSPEAWLAGRFALYRHWLEIQPLPGQAVKEALSHLEQSAPSIERLVIGHGDFRSGNYLLQEGRFTGLLDWEFAGYAAPLEDIGWFTAPCWCYGRHDAWPAGGVARLEDFSAGLETAEARAVEPAELAWWQALACARWAILARWQAWRHLSGARRDPDLAETARNLPELDQRLQEMVARISVSA